MAILLTCNVCLALWEAVLGWCQLFGFKHSLNILYPATGSFYNPGPYCCFLSMILPLCLWQILDKSNKKFIYWISWVYIVISMPLLPILMSRTGWIAAVVGCCFVLYERNKGKIKFPKKRYSILIAISIIAICVALFFIKPESALGRFLIWRNGICAMAKNPIFGVGWDNVSGAIGNAQELYFANNPNNILASVAGSPEYAFNEFLQVGIAFGLLGLTAFITIMLSAFIFSYKSCEYGLAGSILSFVVVCFSSYPLQFPEFIMSIGTLISASVISYKKFNLIVSCIISAIIIAAATYGSSRLRDREKITKEWKFMSTIYSYRLNEKDQQFLDSVMQEYGWNSNFIFDYGKALRENGHYLKSNLVLQRGVKQSSDPMFLNLIGRNYQDLNDNEMAEHYYMRSANRLPGRVYPYYLLTKLYADSANFNSQKFNHYHRKTMTMKPKVQSPAINQMRHELKLLKDSLNNNRKFYSD